MQMFKMALISRSALPGMLILEGMSEACVLKVPGLKNLKVSSTTSVSVVQRNTGQS
jgi:hypothetical protein